MTLKMHCTVCDKRVKVLPKQRPMERLKFYCKICKHRIKETLR